MSAASARDGVQLAALIRDQGPRRGKISISVVGQKDKKRFSLGRPLHHDRTLELTRSSGFMPPPTIEREENTRSVDKEAVNQNCHIISSNLCQLQGLDLRAAGIALTCQHSYLVYESLNNNSVKHGFCGQLLTKPSPIIADCWRQILGFSNALGL